MSRSKEAGSEGSGIRILYLLLVLVPDFQLVAFLARCRSQIVGGGD